MKGYKAFNNDLKCRGYQFVKGRTHVHEGKVVLCVSGFHFCTELQDIVKYYSMPTMRVFEVEASGTITDTADGCSKRACSKIRLVKELSLDDVRDSINKPEPAYEWAIWIGDKEHMKQFIEFSYHARKWLQNIDVNDEQYFIDKGVLPHDAIV